MLNIFWLTLCAGYMSMSPVFCLDWDMNMNLLIARG